MTVAGFVVTVIATVWSFAWVFVRLPRVAVETRRHIRVVPGAERADRIELTVINRGSEAVTISNIGLRADNKSFARDYARDQIDYPDQRPDCTFADDDARLPLRVEGHGALRWIYMPHHLAEFPKGDVRGYAMAYRFFRWPWLSDEALTERTIEARRTELIE
jgi:hypothetical protein